MNMTFTRKYAAVVSGVKESKRNLCPGIYTTTFSFLHSWIRLLEGFTTKQKAFKNCRVGRRRRDIAQWNKVRVNAENR